MMSDVARADRLIKLLDLKPHPEGGYYRETFRDHASTAIYFLLRQDEASRWHRIASAEVWHFYCGAPLELRVGGSVYILGADIDEAQAPQIVVPPGEWQSARSLGEYTLVGCTVAPAFDFANFEIAPDGFEP